MRQIGTLPKAADPDVLRDHLLTLGTSSRAVETADGWAVWVHDEDRVARAREELEAYAADPDDPRFQSASKLAEKVRKENQRLDSQYRKNYKSLKGRWDRIEVRTKPLTAALMAVSIAVFVAGMVSPGWTEWSWNHLGFLPLDDLGPTENVALGLRAIRDGEVWRLVTPIFLHVNLMHIIFNMWALSQAGPLIETRRGTATLAALVFLSAVASNMGQYVYMLNFQKETNPFGGISGVVYALFGYIWVKGRTAPEEGLGLHPNSVRVMLLWLLLGFTGVLHMANGAHVMGLIVGMLYAIAGF